jgi:hypothetical protein
MKRIVLAASLIATFGLAAAASAGEQTKARSHSVYGRNVVWSEPKTEEPYALRGERQEQKHDQKAEKPRIELQSHGRAGTNVEVNRAEER